MPSIENNLNEEKKLAIDEQDVTKQTDSPVENVIDAQVLETETEESPEQPEPTSIAPTVGKAQAKVQRISDSLTKRELAEQERIKAENAAGSQELVVRALGQETLGQGDAQSKAIRESGVNELQSEIDKIDESILTATQALQEARVQDKRDVESISERARGVPARIVQGRQRMLQSQRNAERKLEAIDLQNKIATSELMQGKVDSAKESIKEAIKMKYDDKKAELQLEIGWLKRSDSKLAEAKQKELNAIEKEEQEEQNIFDIAEQARKDGAGASEVKAILSSSNRKEALDNAPSLGQSARLDNQLKLMNINSKSLDIKMQRKKLAELENPESGLNIKPDFTAATFAKRMQDATAILDETERDLGEKIGTITSLGFANREERQKRDQAERNFVNALLRQESGAAIAPEEFKSAAKQYFPDSMDTEETREQKRKNREVVIQGMKLQSGGAYEVLEETIEGSDPDSLLNSFDSDEAPEDFFNDL